MSMSDNKYNSFTSISSAFNDQNFENYETNFLEGCKLSQDSLVHDTEAPNLRQSNDDLLLYELEGTFQPGLKDLLFIDSASVIELKHDNLHSIPFYSNPSLLHTNTSYRDVDSNGEIRNNLSVVDVQIGVNSKSTSKFISYNEALDEFMHKFHKSTKSHATAQQPSVCKKKSSFCSLFRECFRQKESFSVSFENDKNLILFLSHTSFDDLSDLSLRMLRTIYYRLIAPKNFENNNKRTEESENNNNKEIKNNNINYNSNEINGSNSNGDNNIMKDFQNKHINTDSFITRTADANNPNFLCHTTHQSTQQPSFLSLARRGGHWRQIGFQADNPATDLRSGGVLCLLQLLHLLSTSPTLAHLLFTYSNDPSGTFPFCALATNITTMCLVALKRGRLYGVVGKNKNLLDVFNDLYSALFWYFYKLYCKKCKTLRNMNEVMQRIERKSRKGIKQLLRKYPGKEVFGEEV